MAVRRLRRQDGVMVLCVCFASVVHGTDLPDWESKFRASMEKAERSETDLWNDMPSTPPSPSSPDVPETPDVPQAPQMDAPPPPSPSTTTTTKRTTTTLAPGASEITISRSVATSACGAVNALARLRDGGAAVHAFGHHPDVVWAASHVPQVAQPTAGANVRTFPSVLVPFDVFCGSRSKASARDRRPHGWRPFTPRSHGKKASKSTLHVRLLDPDYAHATEKQAKHLSVEARQSRLYRRGASLPSDAALCARYDVAALSGTTHVAVELPMVDETYAVRAALAQSVRHAQNGVVHVVELGTRDASLAAAALQLAKVAKNGIVDARGLA